MKCVENGKLNLDEDVFSILPELKGIEILLGFDEHEKPLFKKAENKITLRLVST
jgi:methyl acetate hydrolase